MTNKKILFTGGNGFIGRQIIPFLEKDGYTVVRPRSTQIRLEVDAEVATLSDNKFFFNLGFNQNIWQTLKNRR